MTHPAEVLTQVVRVLERLRVDYHVGGSIASTRRGTFRSTEDVDLVVDLRKSDLEGLERALAPDFYVSRSAMEEAVATGGTFNAIGLASSFKVDFFLLGPRPFDREEMKRATLETLEGAPIPIRVKSAEDLVIRKLEWYRAGDEVSDLQWRDVLGILVSSAGGLDEAYLDRWAAELGVADLLARARTQARRV